MITISAASDPGSATFGLVAWALLVAVAILVYRSTRVTRRLSSSVKAAPKRASAATTITAAQVDAMVAETNEFMARRARWRELATVRGKVNFEWIEHIDQMKREQRLEEALELTYECMDAAERADQAAGDGSSTWASWVERACIILRKLGDVEAEERLLQRAVQALPGRESLAKRLEKARLLADRSRQESARPNDGASN